MIKFLYASLFLLAFNCASPKSSTEKTVEQPTKNLEKETTKPVKTSSIEKKPTLSKESLVVVLQNPSELEQTKTLLKNSGIQWDRLVLDKQSSKIGIIKVPADKKEFWISKLQQTGEFKNVTNASKKNIEALIKLENSALFSMRKTPCFGDCPTYEISIDKEGKVHFIGRKFVQKKGETTFVLSPAQFQTLQQKLGQRNFSSYETVYDNPMLTDLPSTYIAHQGQEIKIRIWKDVPAELSQVHEYIESILIARKLIN